jgi:hypothetical protein
MVMLGGLIAVPAIALFGTGAIDSVKQLAQRHLGIQCGVAAPALSEAPVFEPTRMANGPVPSPLTAPVVSVPAVPSGGIATAGMATSWPGVSNAGLAPPIAASAPISTMPAAPTAVPVAGMSPATQLVSPASISPTPVCSASACPTVTPASTLSAASSVVPVLSTAPVGANVTQAAAYEVPRPTAVQPAPRNVASEAPLPVAPTVYESATNLVPVPRPLNGPVEARTANEVAAAGNPAVEQPRGIPALQETAGTERFPAATAGNGLDRFAGVQHRLRQLGATYSLLESWGAQSELYRFHCRVAVGGSTNFTRSFEASAADPVEAMAKVAQQIEQWQSSRP